MMSKKLLIKVAPLFATAMFVVAMMAPSGAQASNHQWQNEGGPLAAKVKDFTVGWGTLTLNGAAKVTCHNVIGGWVENETATAAGTGKIETFAPFDCTSNFTCPPVEYEPGKFAPTFPAVEGVLLPWPDHLEENGSGEVLSITQGPIAVLGKPEPEHTAVIVGCNAPELGED